MKKIDPLNAERRSKYADYITAALSFATSETGLQWPVATIIIAKNYLKLAGVDEIVGLRVYVVDMSSPVDFTVAFPSYCEDERRLQTAFREYQELHDFD